MPYYSDDDLDQMADDLYRRVQQRLANDAEYTSQRNRGVTGRFRQMIRTVVTNTARAIFGEPVATVVDIVISWILRL